MQDRGIERLGRSAAVADSLFTELSTLEMCLRRMTDLLRLRVATGWGIRECGPLLTEKGSLAAALDWHKHHVADAHETASGVTRTLDAARRWPWWISDFLARETSELASWDDPPMQRWAEARKEIHDLAVQQRTPDIRTRAGLQKYLDLARQRPFKSNLIGCALSTHLVPKHEVGLEVLREDPFKHLRALKTPTGARLTLIRRSTFDVRPRIDKLTTYVAAYISQAESYFDAARHAQINVRPLLLSYGSACLARVVAATRLSDFLDGKYAHHGFSRVYSWPNPEGLGGYLLEASTQQGLYHAIEKAFPGGRLLASQGPWDLARLASLVPELSSVLNDYGPLRSRSQQNLGWADHVTPEGNQPGINRLTTILPFSYLAQCEIHIPSCVPLQPASGTDINKAVIEVLKMRFPALFVDERVLGRSGPEPPALQSRSRALGGDQVLVVQREAETRDLLSRVYPAVYSGTLDGEWHVVYNEDAEAPSQFLVLHTLLFALGMLVRYKAVEYDDLLRERDISRELIQRICDIAQTKLPILCTELLLRRYFLGAPVPI